MNEKKADHLAMALFVAGVSLTALASVAAVLLWRLP